MPLYMSIHERVPDGASAGDIAAAHRPGPDVRHRHGIRYVGCWIDESAGKVFCLAEAPSAERAAAAHAAVDGPLADRIYEVVAALADATPTEEVRRTWPSP